MTIEQWKKLFKKRLSRLPKSEQERALDYYGELYGDKSDAGMSAEEILREFGAPRAAADKILAEYEDCAASVKANAAKPKTAGNTAARILAVFFLFLFVGLPVLAVIFCLAAAGAAVFISGFAVIVAGVIYIVYFLVQLCMYGGAAYVAHIGVGLAAAGIGALLVPLFLWLTKRLFIGCGKIFVWTGKLVRGKKEAA